MTTGAAKSKSIEPTCERCGYSLAGLDTNRCPECGSAFDPAKFDEIERCRVRHRRQIVTLASAPIVYAIGWLGLTGGIMEVWSPLPMTVLFPAFATESMIAAPLPVALAWLIWTLTAQARSEVPLWSIVGFGILTGMSLLWAGVTWTSMYVPRTTVETVVIITALAPVPLIGLLILNRFRPSFATNLMFHLAVGCWLVSYAFPYAGELP